MSVADEPIPVKFFTAVLFVVREQADNAREKLQQHFGPTDYVSPAFPFQCEEYYAREMGTPIRRIFFSFRELIDPAALVESKWLCHDIEQELAQAGKRTVNIDAGYLDYHKVVLASFKGNNQKIYLGRGVYADMNLLYGKGSFSPFPWTFPDFRDKTYEPVLLHMRSLYKGAVRHILAEKQRGTASGEAQKAESAGESPPAGDGG